MTDEGPPIENLTRRLAECPPDFLAAPRVGGAGTVQVAAVVSDLLRDLGGAPLPAQMAAQFRGRSARADRNRLSVVLVACWLLHDAGLRPSTAAAAAARRDAALALLAGGLAEAAAHTRADQFVTDSDRREELARLCLRALGLRPAGETEAQAQDRLAALNAAERQRVIKAAQQAEARAAAIRAEMQRRAIEDANAKAMRE
jgi:hypothetical protein